MTVNRYRFRLRLLRYIGGLVILLTIHPLFAAFDDFISPIPILEIRAIKGSQIIHLDLPDNAAPDRVFLSSGVDPLGILQLQELETGSKNRYVLSDPMPADFDVQRLEAWRLAPDHVTASLPHWPVEGSLYASITTIGLGSATVWLDAGVNQGVQVGDHWWLRNAGQPVARLDVVFSGARDCFCRVWPLVAGWRPHVADRVQLWPSPGMKRTGRAVSAVVHVRAVPEGQEVWIAALPEAVVGEEARIEFHRGGRFLSSGVIAHRDERFWYARQPAAGVEIRVGDEALVRTEADRAEKRFIGRVFELTPDGGLIDVGEIDGLHVGDMARVVRDGTEIGTAEVIRTQRAYSIARLLPVAREKTPSDEDKSEKRNPRRTSERKSETSSERKTERSRENKTEKPPDRKMEVTPAPQSAPVESLALGDVIRFDSQIAQVENVGVIEYVRGRVLLAVRLDYSAPASLVPLLIRRGESTIGVAIPLKVEGRRALVLALGESLSADPVAGDQLVTSAYGE